MAQINTLVKKIDTLAKTGLFGSPKSPSFMNNVSQEIFSNVSSPVKAAAFAKFYKALDKKKTPSYKGIKMTGATPVKKAIKTAKGDKKKSQKSPSPNYKAIAKLAAKAKANYKKQKLSSMK